MATLKELIAIIKKLNIDVDVTGMKNAELIKEITNAGYDVNGKKVTKKPASKKTSSSYNISEVNDKNIKEKFISVDTDEIINEVINDVVNNKSTINY